MTDDERLARNMAKLDAQRAIREREAAAIKSQRDTAAGKRDEYGNPPTRKRPAKGRPTRQQVARRGSQSGVGSTACTLEAQGRRARIVALNAEGATPLEIAAKEGCSPSTVYGHLRAAGVARRSRPDVWRIQAEKRFEEAGGKSGTVADVAVLAEMYTGGASLSEIAQIVGVVTGTVHRRLVRAGVTMRKPGWRVAA